MLREEGETLLPSLHGQDKKRVCQGQKAGPLPVGTRAAAGADAAGWEHTGMGAAERQGLAVCNGTAQGADISLGGGGGGRLSFQIKLEN